MIKLVAFDWNGTLFPDSQACLDSCNHVFEILGLKPLDLATYRNTFIVPISKLYIAGGLNQKEVTEKSAFIAETWHAHYENRASKLRTRRHTKNVLANLKSKGIGSLIFSNHTQVGIKNQLKRLALESFITTVIANAKSETAMKKRGKKEKLRAYIISQKLNFNEVLVVGDSTEEIEIGEEFGSPTVAITNGHISTTRLKAAKPNYLINNLRQIEGIISKLQG